MAANRDELRRQLLTLGPPEAVEVLMAVARDCIFLRRERCDDAEIPIGASKIGGAPDVPVDFVWPQGVYDPMSFLAQIDLEEIAALPPSVMPPEQGVFDFGESLAPASNRYDILPRSGLLSFFYELEAPLGDESGNEARFCRVLHFAPGTSLVRTAPPPMNPLPITGRWQELNEEQSAQGVGPTYRPCRLASEPLVQPPGGYFASVLEPHWRDFDHPDPVQQLASAYDEGSGWWSRTPRHQMFGYPAIVQDDRDTPGQLLLLQLDSDEEAGIEWGDVGTLYCFLPGDDLRRADFSHAWMTWDCS